MNISDIITLLEQIESKIEQCPDMILEDTIYEHTDELLEDINDFIIELEEGNFDAVEYIDIHFLPQSTIASITKHNKWDAEAKDWLSAYELARG